VNKLFVWFLLSCGCLEAAGGRTGVDRVRRRRVEGARGAALCAGRPPRGGRRRPARRQGVAADGQSRDRLPQDALRPPGNSVPSSCTEILFSGIDRLH